MSPLSFDSAWPALLLLLLPLVWRARQRVPGSGPRHRTAAAALRCTALALALLAATQPVWWRPGRALAVVHLLDGSWSVDPAARAASLDWIRRAETHSRPDSSTSLVFGGSTAELPSGADAGRLQLAAAEADADSSDLAQALEAARARLPAHGLRRIVLASDGRATRGDLEPVLWRLIQAGIRVHALPLPPRGGPNATAVRLELPQPAAAGEPLRATAWIDAVAAAPASVEVWSGERPLAAARVELSAGSNRVPLELVLERPGLEPLELRVRAEGDAHPEDDSWPLLAIATRRPRVLHLEGRLASARFLRRALEAAGFDVTSAGPEAARPASLEGRDAVVLSDLPARRLSAAFQAALQLFVRDGGGLVLVGGEAVYGEQGYSNTLVEATLPVRFEIREEKRDLALMIVLDKSYSMKGPKMELAKQATRAALELLEERHRFGVVSFDWDPYVTVPLQPATDKPAMAEAIGRIRASAQTNIFPALEEAFEQLALSDAKVKHVILLSDGRSYPDDYEGLVRRMREAEISVSTVAVGAEADRELLGAIATWGDGRRYAIEDASRVQQVFVEETRRAVQATLVEEPFRPVLRSPSALLAGVELGAAPPLRGYVSTQARPGAEVLLESPTGAPLLARWRFGLGAAVAFTSDAKDRWAADWLGWSGYGRFWAQVVRSVLRREPARASLQVAAEDGAARAELLLRDAQGRTREGLRLELAARQGAGPERRLPLLQVGPGRYQARFALGDAAEAWRFRVSGVDEEDAVAGLVPEPPAERRLRPADLEGLGRIAALSGGVLAPSPETALERGAERGRIPTPLLPWLAAAALLAWLLDVAVRRAPWFWKRWSGEAEPLGARPASG